MTFATDKLLAMKGIDRAKADAPWAQTELLVSLDDICAAFWETKDGRAMRDQLDNHPVDKCAAGSCLALHIEQGWRSQISTAIRSRPGT